LSKSDDRTYQSPQPLFLGMARWLLRLSHHVFGKAYHSRPIRSVNCHANFFWSIPAARKSAIFEE